MAVTYLVVGTMKRMREIAIKSCSLFGERRWNDVHSLIIFIYFGADPRYLFQNARKGD